MCLQSRATRKRRSSNTTRRRHRQRRVETERSFRARSLSAHPLTGSLLDLREPHRLAAAVLKVIASGEQRSIAAQIAFVRDICGASIGFGARIRTHAQRRPQSGIEVTVAERLLQGSESRLAGAVAGSDVINFVGVMQGGGNFLDR